MTDRSAHYDLIIFDCDGTLVDTEYLCNSIVADLLAEAGLPQYDVDYALRHFIGRTVSGVRAMVEAETGRALPQAFDDYVRRVNEGLPDGLKIIDGVAETVRHLHGRMKICVGSNGERANVLKSLRIAGLSDFFPDDRVFTKNMVKHAKPAPDLYLLAAQTMGAAPSRTLVIEDSVAGATAGVAAGMTVIGFTATFHDKAGQAAALRAAGAAHVTARFVDIVDVSGVCGVGASKSG